MMQERATMNVEEQFERSDRAFEYGDYNQVLDLMLQVVSLYPSNSRAYLYTARAYAMQHDYTEAMHAIKTSLSLNPQDDMAHAVYGYLLGKHRHPAEAHEEFQKALEIHPERALTHFWYASFWLESYRNTEQARRHLAEAMRLDPHEGAHHLLLARIHETEMTFDEAEREYIRSVKLNPTFEALNSCGLFLLHRRQDPKRAFDYFRRALTLAPKDRRVLGNFMYTLKAKNRPMYEFWNWNFKILGMLGGKFRWVLVIGLWAMIQILQIWGEASPQWKPVIGPIVLAYIVFCIYTWVVNPIFKLLIRQGWIR